MMVRRRAWSVTPAQIFALALLAATAAACCSSWQSEMGLHVLPLSAAAAAASHSQVPVSLMHERNVSDSAPHIWELRGARLLTVAEERTEAEKPQKSSG